MKRPFLVLALSLLVAALAPLATQAQGTIFPGETGPTLRASLKASFAPGTVLTIGNARDTLFAVIDNEPGDVVTDVYAGFAIVRDPAADPNTDALGKGLNVEHTLPQSKGATEGTQAHSNLHNIFPARIDVNTDRSNFPFAEIDDADTDFWYCDGDTFTTPPGAGIIDTCSEFDADAEVFEPREDHKGNAARAVFYMATLYDDQLDNAFFTTQMNTLRDWHDADPADADEADRSARIALYQDDQENPYVLDETLVERAYFTTDDVSGVQLSEIRIDQPSTDNDEYFELEGPAATALDGLTYLVIGDGTGGSGVLENATDLLGQSLDGNGFFVAAEATFSLGTANLTTTLAFENSDNVTHLLVQGFSGTVGDDLDTDDDGTLDVLPWTAVLDALGLVETVGSGDQVYGAALGFEDLGPDGSNVPGHVARLGGAWAIGAFDPADGDDTPGAPNALLPVELTTFEALVDAAAVVLSWTTASETRNAGFSVEHRPLDGPPGWQPVGFVEGAGTTTTAHDYRFRLDGLGAGRHAFRLRQIDLDGTFAYSPEIEVSLELATAFALSPAYPNPFNPTTTLRLSVRETQPVTLAVYNALGQRVRVLFEGTMAANTARAFTFAATGLPSGLYAIRAEGTTFVTTRTVTLLK